MATNFMSLAANPPGTNETNYLRRFWIHIYNILSIGKEMDADNKSDICFLIAQGGHCYGNQFSKQIVKNRGKPFCLELNYVRIC